ncbi:hypothetical protein [Massilia sp. TS11]|uniref:hypothetical protein n=1 Tax=Massilia sp. TS11 TaxID=2908003 RepID=UPI001ED9F48D|nr:hypothetical protein [Massilia sp. TS11]MCG2583665.1 hypothetical protein [Massilia sp. TS11]
MKHEGRSVIRLNDKTGDGGKVVYVLRNRRHEHRSRPRNIPHIFIAMPAPEREQVVPRPNHARTLRVNIWGQLTSDKINCSELTNDAVKYALANWEKQAKRNRRKQQANSLDPRERKMEGLIVPLDDSGKSLIRLG